MADLLSYQGNAGLGLGANPGIPAPDNVALNQISSAARDIMLQDNQWNVIRFQQKQKNLEKLRDAIDSGEVAKGEILPEYQPVFDASKKKVEAFFQKNGDKFTEDAKLYREYKTLVRDLKDVATHAQVNTHAFQELQAEKAKQTLPAKQTQVQKFIDAQKAETSKDFWNQIKPYQQVHDFNIADITGISPNATIKSSHINPNDPADAYDSTAVDYDQILKEKYNDFINDTTGEKADSQTKFYQKLQDYSPLELGKTLNAMDEELLRYNKERGFTKSSPGYVQPIEREIVGGRLILKESVPEFTAKYALTNQGQFVTKTPKFNKDVASYQIAKERANTDAVYKRIMGSVAQQKAKAYAANTKSQIAARKDPAEQTQYMEEMYDRNLLNQPSLIRHAPGKKVGSSDVIFNAIPAAQSLPVFTMEGSKVVPLKPINGKEIIVNKKVVGYEKGYYEPQYRIGGKPLNIQQLTDKYNAFKKKAGSDWNGSMDEFLKQGIQRGNIDFLIKGANGTVDRKLSLATQRAMSNADTQKGETGIFEPAPDEQLPDSQTPQE